MPYILDTSVFIAAKGYHYAFGVCPGFWEWLVGQNGDGSVYGVQAVNDELQKGGDEPAEWAGRAVNSFCPRTSPQSAPRLQ